MISSLRERLVIQTPTAAIVALSSLTRIGGTATAIASAPHGLITGDYATVAGALPVGYNGKVQVTVTGQLAFTFPVSAITTPATGSPSATYTSDSQGGRAVTWRTLETVWAEFAPFSVSERLQMGAIQSTSIVRFRIRVRPDLTPAMRVLWTPSAPQGALTKTLVIVGLPLDDDGRRFMFIEATGQA